jgi:hypothetical protein
MRTVPKCPPVDLGLLAGQRPDPQVRLGRRSGTIARHDRPAVVGPARVAAAPDHLEEPAGAQARVLLERLLDEGHVGVGHRRPHRHAPGVEPRLREHAPDGAVVQAELCGDGADTPLLGMVEAQDRRLSVAADHDVTFRWRWAWTRGSCRSTRPFDEGGIAAAFSTAGASGRRLRCSTRPTAKRLSLVILAMTATLTPST